MADATLIGLDWGTSSLRAYLFGEKGDVVGQRDAPAGIQAVRDGRFREAYESLCADWLAAAPQVPVIACGMIGSRQGWREAAYVPTTAGFDGIAAALLALDDLAGRPFRVVPGISTTSPAGTHDVIRGEETQVFGALARLAVEDATVVLPGTHSKWVRVRERRIVGFRTYLTGELYAVLARHSILGRLFAEAPPAPPRPGNDPAFADGLALAAADPAGLTSLLFSVRAEGLFGRYTGQALPSYLSGLLVGAEVAHAAADRALAARGEQAAPMLLVGADELVERYAVALAHVGLPAAKVPGVPAAQGLFTFARTAGLVR